MSLESIRKLREWLHADAYEHPDLMELVDEIEREIAEKYMLLPVDADGVPIRVGDSLKWMMNDVKASAVAQGRVFYWDEYDEMHWVHSDECHHVKPRTVEDVLREFADEATDIDWRDDDEWPQLLAKYAAELRMRDAE